MGEKMSHLRRCSVNIKTVNAQLLRLTMESMVKYLAGQGFENVRIVDKVADFYVRRIERNVVTGIVADNIRGFGIVVRDGKPEIVGDDYAQGLRIEEFRRLFENFYTATAMQEALKTMGYQVNATVLPKMEVVVRGVKSVGYGV